MSYQHKDDLLHIEFGYMLASLLSYEIKLLKEEVTKYHSNVNKQETNTGQDIQPSINMGTSDESV